MVIQYVEIKGSQRYQHRNKKEQIGSIKAGKASMQHVSEWSHREYVCMYVSMSVCIGECIVM